MIRSRLNLLYTNIGRGHPFYLDGLVDALKERPEAWLNIHEFDVTQVSSGLSAAAWKAVRKLYEVGASSGIVGSFYQQVRRGNNYNRDSLGLQILGHNLRQRFVNNPDPLVVAHPILVGALRGKENLIYQHGELVAPSESLVTGAALVLVPTEAVASQFLGAGYDSRQVVVTGPNIEPPLAALAEAAYTSRRQRYEQDRSLCGLYLSSGAEPQQHVRAVISSACSSVTAGGRVIILAHKGGRLVKQTVREAARRSIPVGSFTQASEVPSELPLCSLLIFDSRKNENELVAAVFDRLDYFVGPPHERTHWAVSLGLPMLVLTPTFGTYAPLNLELLLALGAAAVLESGSDAEYSGARLVQMKHDGSLAQMAAKGWRPGQFSGFARAAEVLVARFGGQG